MRKVIVALAGVTTLLAAVAASAQVQKKSAQELNSLSFQNFVAHQKAVCADPAFGPKSSYAVDICKTYGDRDGQVGSPAMDPIRDRDLLSDQKQWLLIGKSFRTTAMTCADSRKHGQVEKPGFSASRLPHSSLNGLPF